MFASFLQSPILGLLIAPLVMYLGDAIHYLWPWLDRQNAMTKQAFALLLSVALVGLSRLIPGAIPTDCANVVGGVAQSCRDALASPVFLQQVVSATLGAIAVKHGQQAKA